MFTVVLFIHFVHIVATNKYKEICNMWTLAIDAMGGDNAPKAIIDGTVEALARYDNIKILMYGIESEIRKHLPEVPGLPLRILSSLQDR